MTVEELKGILNTAVSIGNLLAPLFPGQWDDVALEGLVALSQSDPLLEFIARYIPQPTFGAPPQSIVLKAADGTEHAIDPTFLVVIQIVLAIIKLIQDRRNG